MNPAVAPLAAVVAAAGWKFTKVAPLRYVWENGELRRVYPPREKRRRK